MARRLFNGRAFSEDGWPYVDEDSCRWVKIAANASIQIQDGVPAAIMGAFARDYDAHVETIFDADSASWTPGNSVATSNHPGATAMDIRWDSHPFERRGTFTAAQLAVIQELLDYYEGMIFWAGIDWSEGGWGSPIDEMHWQMGYGTYDQGADRPYQKCLDFCARKIRADGFSTFGRGNAALPNDPALILSRATGLDLNKATEILPTMQAGLKAADCTNPNRIAMFTAQTGHESADFERTEEYASGAAYEGRTDLGNTQPGDGVRFKGRSWIQITGRHNYGEFSEWAFGKGLVPTPTYFVDHPVELQDIKWAGIGAAWYWTVARGTRINEASDRGDLVTVTQLINGGQNGIDDRRMLYNRALAVGDELTLILNSSPGDDMAAVPQEQWDRVYRELTQLLADTNMYRTSNTPNDTFAGKARGAQTFGWEGRVEECAKRGESWAIELVAKAAAGVLLGVRKADGSVDQFLVDHATAVLNEVAAINPAALEQHKKDMNV